MSYTINTNLRDIIYSNLLNLEDKRISQIEKRIFQTKLNLSILGNTVPGKQFNQYLTDKKFSIQFIKENKNKQQMQMFTTTTPTNVLQTPFYIITQNRWHPFNCPMDLLNRQTPQYLNPYCPEYYFKSNLKDFVQQKAKLRSYMLSCSKIEIKRWRFKIVNVSKTGWYAPVIEALDYHQSITQNKEECNSISCILYEPKMQEFMERLRLTDLRNANKNTFDSTKKVSLLFYTRDLNLNKPKELYNKIYCHDQTKVVLRYKDNLKINYILFNNTQQGALMLQRQLQNIEIDKEKIKNIEIERISLLLNSKKRPTIISSQEQSQQNDLWSQDDGHEPQKRMIDQDDQQSEQQEQPLRAIYMKEIRDKVIN